MASAAISYPSPSLEQHINAVQKYSLSTLGKVLCFFAGFCTLFTTWGYWAYNSYQQEKALQKLADAVTQHFDPNNEICRQACKMLINNNIYAQQLTSSLASIPQTPAPVQPGPAAQAVDDPRLDAAGLASRHNDRDSAASSAPQAPMSASAIPAAQGSDAIDSDDENYLEPKIHTDEDDEEDYTELKFHEDRASAASSAPQAPMSASAIPAAQGSYAIDSDDENYLEPKIHTDDEEDYTEVKFHEDRASAASSSPEVAAMAVPDESDDQNEVYRPPESPSHVRVQQPRAAAASVIPDAKPPQIHEYTDKAAATSMLKFIVGAAILNNSFMEYFVVKMLPPNILKLTTIQEGNQIKFTIEFAKKNKTEKITKVNEGGYKSAKNNELKCAQVVTGSISIDPDDPWIQFDPGMLWVPKTGFNMDLRKMYVPKGTVIKEDNFPINFVVDLKSIVTSTQTISVDAQKLKDTVDHIEWSK